MATSSSIEETGRRASKRKRDLLFCGHCEKYVSKSSFYRHRDAYFDPVLGKWERENHRLLEISVQENETVSDTSVHMENSEIDEETSNKILLCYNHEVILCIQTDPLSQGEYNL